MEQALLDLTHAFAAHAASVAPLLERYGYAGIFVTSLVEGFGIPAPGQTLLALGALAAARGELDILTVVALAWSATILGNLVGYLIGRRAGRRLLLRMGVRRQRLRRVEGFVRRYGPGLIVVARFVDGLRQLGSLVAGSVNMPWPLFLGSIVVGATLWAGLVGFAAYALGRDFHAIVGLAVAASPYAWLAVGAALLAVIAWLLGRRRAP